ncbi:MAG: hypothetical protein ACQEQ8_05550 [Pseudomonadota bacterium]
MNKFILTTVVSLFAVPAFAWAPVSDGQNIPNNVKAEIQQYAELGTSATGEELAAVLWRLGEANQDYGSAMWDELSAEQKQSIYLSKIESFLRSPESNSLTPEQNQFIEKSKVTLARAFDENWDENTDEYLYFSMRSIEVLGVELAGQLYGAGALWPRTPTTLTVSNAD